MKLEKGRTVTIRHDIAGFVDKHLDDVYVNEDMGKMGGLQFEIEYVWQGHFPYVYDLIGTVWAFTNEMFEETKSQ